MKQKLLTKIFLLALLLVPAAGFMAPAYAACGNSSAAQQVSNGINETTTTPGTACNDNGVQNAIKQAVQILSLIVGVAAIIVIILSGFKYITSGGDSAKVGNAKNTLIYALVGLVIAALAQVLVHFVLFQSNAATLPACPPDGSSKPPACRA
jgi:hypothetical protein